MRPLVLAFLFSVLSPIGPLHAEIILDDFDESFQLDLPDDISFGGDDFIIQSDIGPLGVERWSQVVSISSDPVGFVDADFVHSSALNIKIDRLNRTQSELSLSSVTLNLNYFFDEIDITENRSNQVAAVDFAFLQSAVPLERVVFILWDASRPGDSFVSQRFNIPTQEKDFSLHFPFDSFSRRGDGQKPVEFQRVNRALLSISPTRYSGPDELNFSAVIDRIRFTNAIPEPSSALSLGVGMVLLIIFSSRRMKLCRCGYILFSR